MNDRMCSKLCVCRLWPGGPRRAIPMRLNKCPSCGYVPPSLRTAKPGEIPDGKHGDPMDAVRVKLRLWQWGAKLPEYVGSEQIA